MTDLAMDAMPQLSKRPIGRRQLVALLLAISLIPPIFVVTMVATHLPPPEPRLEVTVALDVTVHTPRRSPDSPRILPCLVVTNPTADPWRNVTVYVNKDFFFAKMEGIAGGESFTVPLEFFVTKGGNVAFQPGSEKVQHVTVFAQIPSGARAVREIDFDADGNEVAPVESPQE